MEIKEFCNGLQHIGVPTNDIEATIDFYTRLGFDVEMRTVNGTEKVAFLRFGNLVIETYQNNCAALCDGAINHYAIDVIRDIDALHALVVEKGFKVLEGVTYLPFWENGVKFFIIEGPNKERIEFCQRL